MCEFWSVNNHKNVDKLNPLCYSASNCVFQTQMSLERKMIIYFSELICLINFGTNFL